MTKEILWLAEYGVQTGLICEEDRSYTINRLMELFCMDDLGEETILELPCDTEHLAEVLEHMNDYAAKLNISPNHLNKVVKGTTGKSTSNWIEEAIMLKAKMLLKCTGLHLSEIAAKVGIMDQSYFARKFKQHEGITPSEYRQLQKGASIKDKND